MYNFNHNSSVNNYDYLGLEVLAVSDGRQIYVLRDDGKIWQIKEGRNYKIPEGFKWNDKVLDFHLKEINGGERSILSRVILEDRNRAFSKENKERLKQSLSLVLSFSAPLKVLKALGGGVKLTSNAINKLSHADTLNTTYSLVQSGIESAKKDYDIDSILKIAWEFSGYIPIWSTGKALSDLISYESKSIKPFYYPDVYPFVIVGEPIDLRCYLPSGKDLNESVISEAIIKYHSNIK